MSLEMERVLAQGPEGMETPHTRRVLELNASHPLVEKMKGLEGAALADMASLLYDGALIAEGSPVADGAAFAKRLSDLLLK